MGKKSSFPVATPQDTEMHFIGSGAMGYGWWEEMQSTFDLLDPIPDNWEFRGRAGYPEDFTEHVVVLNHATILKAIRKIARKGSELGVSPVTISECLDWIFKGPDACDFDAGMADEVMQIVAFGVVTYA